MVLWDKENMRLLLVRYYLGIESLYYFWDEKNDFWFINKSFA